MKKLPGKSFKYFRIQKAESTILRRGFEFMAYSKVENFHISLEENQIIINFSTSDNGDLVFRKLMEKNTQKKFIKNWDLFLLNDEYFFDLADFTREI